MVNKKLSITVSGKDVVGSGPFEFSTLPTIEEIEQFVIEAGSDHVPTFGGKYEGGIQAQQVPDEIAPCIHAILESGQPINAYLEIGAAAGGTTYLINHFLKPKQIVLIDNNQHPKHHVRPYILSQVERKEIIGDSHAEGTELALAEMKVKFDLILIDGDHSYDGCKMDVEIYREFLADGGFMMFHDSVLADWGVKQVVAELQTDEGVATTGLEFVGEYVSQKHNHPCGLALFRKVGA